MTGYQVDLAELENIHARLRGFVGFLDETLAALQQRVGALQQNWTGAAADAQAAAFANWATAAGEVIDSIEAMRTAAADAHQRYTAAIDTNLRTLGRR